MLREEADLLQQHNKDLVKNSEKSVKKAETLMRSFGGLQKFFLKRIDLVKRDNSKEKKGKKEELREHVIYTCN